MGGSCLQEAGASSSPSGMRFACGVGELPFAHLGAQSMVAEQCADSSYILQAAFIGDKNAPMVPSAYSFVLSLHFPKFGWEEVMLFMGSTKTPSSIGCDRRDD